MKKIILLTMNSMWEENNEKMRNLRSPDKVSDLPSLVSVSPAGQGSCPEPGRERPGQAAEQTLQIRGWRRLRLEARLVLGLKTHTAITQPSLITIYCLNSHLSPHLLSKTFANYHLPSSSRRVWGLDVSKDFYYKSGQSKFWSTKTETFHRHLSIYPI